MTIDALNAWLVASTIAVIVGVILEGAEHVEEYREHGWRPILPKLGFTILVFGLAGELVFQTWIGIADKSRIVQLEKGIEEQRSRNLALEAQLASRHLTTSQMHLLISHLRPYVGKTVAVVSYALDVEGATFGESVLRMLRKANMRTMDRRLTVEALGSLSWGIHVSGPDEELGIAVALGFHDNGFLSVFDSHPVLATMTVASTAGADTVIFIGPKPPSD